MSEILFQYVRVYPTTWVYLSSLLMLGLFFKCGRFWSVRNLDLVLLVLLAPGLLLVESGQEKAVAAREAAPAIPSPATIDPAPAGVADEGQVALIAGGDVAAGAPAS